MYSQPSLEIGGGQTNIIIGCLVFINKFRRKSISQDNLDSNVSNIFEYSSSGYRRQGKTRVTGDTTDNLYEAYLALPIGFRV